MISVCLATYNASVYIEQQLESILVQLAKTDEVIIVDDGSDDDTITIIESFSDDRIIISKSIHSRLGVVKNFERALAQAKGDYIFLSDQDDVWVPTKVEETLKHLRHSVLTVSDCKVVDATLRTLHHSFFELRGSKPGFARNLIKNSYLGCCMAFNRELLMYALPIPRNVPMHDMWLGLIAETIGNVTYIEKPLVLYRRHNNNASPTSEKSKFTLYKKAKIRALLLYLLLARILRNLLTIKL